MPQAYFVLTVSCLDCFFRPGVIGTEQTLPEISIFLSLSHAGDKKTKPLFKMSLTPKVTDIEMYSPPLTGDSHASTIKAESIDSSPKQTGTRSGLRGYLFNEVDRTRSDMLLIVCCFVGGLVDGLSYNSWGNFCNMQTGT